jgi:hypothetical protein
LHDPGFSHEGDKDEEATTDRAWSRSTAALVVAVSPMAAAHADNPGSYTITLNGQQVAQGNDGECKDLSGALTINLPKGFFSTHPAKASPASWTSSWVRLMRPATLTGHR